MSDIFHQLHVEGFQTGRPSNVHASLLLLVPCLPVFQTALCVATEDCQVETMDATLSSISEVFYLWASQEHRQYQAFLALVYLKQTQNTLTGHSQTEHSQAV